MWTIHEIEFIWFILDNLDFGYFGYKTLWCYIIFPFLQPHCNERTFHIFFSNFFSCVPCSSFCYFLSFSNVLLHNLIHFQKNVLCCFCLKKLRTKLAFFFICLVRLHQLHLSKVFAKIRWETKFTGIHRCDTN